MHHSGGAGGCQGEKAGDAHFRYFRQSGIGVTAEAVFPGGVIGLGWKRNREVNKMDWQIIVALVIAIPVILFPAAFVWYLNIGGIYTAIKEARARRVARQKEEKVEVVAK